MNNPTFKSIKVNARSFNRKTGKSCGQGRTEDIKSDNTMFAHCKTIIDIKRIYESFWNDMNPQSEDIVFVQKIDVIFR